MANPDRLRRLSNGLMVYGASPHLVREEFVVREYSQFDFGLAPGATVLDVGANIGLFSLELLRRYAGAVRIFAFEPAPRSFAFLERNMRELFPDAPASCTCCAVGERPGRTTLYFRPRLSEISSLHREPQVDSQSFLDGILKERPGHPQSASRLRQHLRPIATAVIKLLGWWTAHKIVEIPCEVTTISEIIRQSTIERIDLLKVDVEGAELAVLRGIDAADWPKIRALLAEVHDLDGRLETVRGILESAGFDRIAARQEWPFVGTIVYMLEASRSADAPVPAGEASPSLADPPA